MEEIREPGSINCMSTEDKAEVYFPDQFYPPVLGSLEEFYCSALARGIPLANIELLKPDAFSMSDPSLLPSNTQDDKEATASKRLHNWDKWCAIWRQTQKALLEVRQNNDPTLMTSVEAYRSKVEDKELFDRTVHHYYFQGYNEESRIYPLTIPFKNRGSQIQETLTQRKLGNPPEMEKIMYNPCIRKEMSLPKKKDGGGDRKEWERPWASSVAVRVSKDYLKPDMEEFIHMDAKANDLILQGDFMGSSNEVAAASENLSSSFVPYLTFTTPTSAPAVNLVDDSPRGPILKVVGEKFELTMNFKKLMDPEFLNQDMDYQDFIRDEVETPFAVTNNSKEMVYILLRNEGTTAIRFQWLRFPPNSRTKQLLADFSLHSKSDFELKVINKFKSAVFSDSSMTESSEEDSSTFYYSPSLGSFDLTLIDDNTQATQLTQELTERHRRIAQSHSNDARYCLAGQQDGKEIEPIPFAGPTREAMRAAPRFFKEATFDFYFRELPDIILPGQSINFPIIFKPRKPGVFHETLYLLTHPFVCNESFKGYSIHLTGLCIEPESNVCGSLKTKWRNINYEKVQQKFRKDNIKCEASRMVNEMVNSIQYFRDQFGDESLNSRIAETVFYAHNPDWYYHFGDAENAVEMARSLVSKLIPKKIVEEEARICVYSIESLHNTLCYCKSGVDYFWNKFLERETEKELQQFHEMNQKLIEPRSFSWPCKSDRKFGACLSSLIATLEEAYDKVFIGDFAINDYTPSIATISPIAKYSALSNRLFGGNVMEQPEIQNTGNKTTKTVDHDLAQKQANKSTIQKSNYMSEISKESLSNASEEKESSVDGDTIVNKEEELQTSSDTLELDTRFDYFRALVENGVKRILNIVDSFNITIDYRESDLLTKPKEYGC